MHGGREDEEEAIAILLVCSCLILVVDREGVWKHLSVFVEIRVWLWLL